MKKTIVVSIVWVVGILAILFWVAFAIIAYRNESIVADFKGNSCSDDPYIKYGSVNYYIECADEVYISDLRFIFKTNKRKLSEIIKAGEFINLLSKLNVYKYYANRGLETKYYTDDKKLVITKCEYWENNTEKIHYVIDDAYDPHICNNRYYLEMN